MSAGVNLFQLPLKSFHLRLQNHSFHVGIGRPSSGKPQPKVREAAATASASCSTAENSIGAIAGAASTVHHTVDSISAIGGQVHQTAILLDEILAFLS